MNLHYLIGDATDPVVKPSLICHVCNDCQPGKWGAGFVMALSAKNKAPQEAYLHWSKEGASGGYELGAVQLVSFAEGVTVANMIAQHGTRWNGKIPPIRYDALETCLKSAYKHALENKLTVAMPRIGCVLAGGDWPTIEAIIKKTMIADTYVYTIESQKDRWPTQYENDTATSDTVAIETDPDPVSTDDAGTEESSDLGDLFK